jgi:hypothetical protein
MADSRLPGQYASLSSEAPTGDTVRIILHAGEPLGSVGHTRVFAAGYGSIEVYRRAETRLESGGFERQGAMLSAIGLRQQELLAYPRYVAAFDATVEGGCGESTLALAFDTTGRVSEVGQVEEHACGS